MVTRYNILRLGPPDRHGNRPAIHVEFGDYHNPEALKDRIDSLQLANPDEAYYACAGNPLRSRDE